MSYDSEKNFEENIEEYLISAEGGWSKATDDGYRSAAAAGKALDLDVLLDFVKRTQAKAWARFEKQCNEDPRHKFYKCFEDAVQTY